MPKTRISEYSTTNSDNTDIESININEGCAPSGINNAIRELMVHLKEWQSGAADTYNTPAGTVSAPAIAPTGDSNTGIFFPAADTIAFAEGGVESMRIDSSGNVLVGATSASYGSGSGVIIQRSGTATLRLSDATNSKVAELRADSTGVILSARGAYPIRFDQDDTERMRITSAGEVLVGGTTSLNASSGAMSLQAAGGGSFNLFRNDTSVVSGDFFGAINFWGNDTTSNTPTAHAYIGATASGTHAAGDNPTDIVFGCTNDGSETVDEFARIGQAGTVSRNFRLQQPTLTNGNGVDILSAGGTAGTVNRYSLIGVFKHSTITNACGYLQLSAEDAATNYLWADNSDVLRISTTASNIGTTGGTVVGTQTSDERLKDISGSVSYGLNEVLAIQPIAFTMKDDPSIPKIGFSAQQVQPIVPEAVYDTRECIDGYTENEETKEQIANSDRTKLAMEYTQLIPVLVNAVKELSAKNDALEARIAALESA